ncbi:Aste57867_1899 [Aphanomyces stellatus]|uniref:Aste57867_1899 protein n=1 Tax=Aphanomyces stellatus TaxID=120398 RepID=A0A485K7B6_9STRA|nr:hypothetical protein As57867_001897 [Aphanomyces stellatus]VFT79106.1 Aste57867_1899 [Aphanomyces stellatus]
MSVAKGRRVEFVGLLIISHPASECQLMSQPSSTNSSPLTTAAAVSAATSALQEKMKDNKRRYPVKEELNNLRVEIWHLESKLIELQKQQQGSMWKQVATHEAHARDSALEENAKLKYELDMAFQWIQDMKMQQSLEMTTSSSPLTELLM